MAKTNGHNEHQELVDGWAKAQAKVEKAQKELDAARAETAKFAKGIYDAVGTKPFSVAALGGRGYRALYKPARTHKTTGTSIGEQYNVLPLPDFTAKLSF